MSDQDHDGPWNESETDHAELDPFCSVQRLLQYSGSMHIPDIHIGFSLLTQNAGAAHLNIIIGVLVMNNQQIKTILPGSRKIGCFTAGQFWLS